MDGDPNAVPELVRQALELALGGEHDAARAVLGRIDNKRLISERRMALRVRHVRVVEAAIWKRDPGGHMNRRAGRRVPVSETSKLSIFRRDHFVCRYSHCRRRTLYIPVLKALSGLFPDLIPYQSNWRPPEDHILYWTYATSIEHVIPFPYGGTSDPGNLITACYQCNDTKNMLDASELGWEVAEVEESEWDGLARYLPQLLSRARPGGERYQGVKKVWR